MELLKFNHEGKEITTSVEMVQDFIEEKMCKVLIKIFEKFTSDGEQVEQSYNLVEAFFYEETWDDKQVVSFATEKIQKRFNLK